MKPEGPIAGEIYDEYTDDNWSRHIWTGSKWVKMGTITGEKSVIPTGRELSEHESLRTAWENYLITRNLLGL